ncbi:MAG: MCP four helix bundle domain-containing protein [Burkholderiaceae bacterium]|nr:MCP four helix bundle domain-containing protein [Burkholderiaceae bacterium]
MSIANLKIGTRLGLGFAVVLALMLGLTMTGIGSAGKIQDNLDHIINGNVYKMGLLQEMSDSLHIVARVTRTMVILTDEAAMAAEFKKIEAARTNYIAAWDALSKTPSDEAGLAMRAKIAQLQAAARAQNDKVLDLAMANKKTEATEMLIKLSGPATQLWLDALHDDIALQKSNGKLDADSAHAAYQSGRALMLGLTALAISLGSVLAWWVTRSITGPLRAAVKVAETVASGDLSSQIEIRSRDETGQLLLALKNMNASLQQIVGQVHGSTDTIATASRQIAAGNLDLSSRTEQQASALEETASSMEELTSTVRQNADNARQANVLAESASEVAVKGGQVVARVVDTMGAIDSSSKKIVDIIGVIDGIAFQTNILALNAAVEAARAGEQGRGFAVVATEVRNLAQRSAAAAKEIKQLIDASVEQVEVGSKLVGQAGLTMDEVVSSVRHVTDIMGEIAAASREQEAGIEQINQAITEMDNVTQQNAALVEEAAAAAQSMQEQAGNLAQVVSVFKLDGMRAVAAPRAVRSVAAPAPRKAKVAPLKLKAAPAKQGASQKSAAGDDWEEF